MPSGSTCADSRRATAGRLARAARRATEWPAGCPASAAVDARPRGRARRAATASASRRVVMSRRATRTSVPGSP
ncbi:conserved hypothetical protein [Ricinus communis]|uniref:Uncharacterized protein n=1 Tax=Ricinus communis TaxID=3988 RepID=B9TDH9_RICCO|nr:conserved hypothetical protein [Ricinus communis]